MTSDLILRDIFFKKYRGDEIQKCIQCGTCSGSCPFAPYMDYGPRQIFAMAREGDMNEVLRANTIWFCVSCYNCVVKCPRKISITDHMYSLKKMAIEQGIKTPDMLDFYHAFNFPVEEYGRLTDTAVMAKFGLRHPVAALVNLPLGIRLALKKRLGIKPRPLDNLPGFRKIMAKTEEIEKIEKLIMAERATMIGKPANQDTDKKMEKPEGVL